MFAVREVIPLYSRSLLLVWLKAVLPDSCKVYLKLNAVYVCNETKGLTRKDDVLKSNNDKKETSLKYVERRIR